MSSFTFWEEVFIKISPIVVGGGILSLIKYWVTSDIRRINQEKSEYEVEKLKIDNEKAMALSKIEKENVEKINEKLSLEIRKLQVDVDSSQIEIKTQKSKAHEMQTVLNRIVKNSLANYLYKQLWEIAHKDCYIYHEDGGKTKRTLVLLRDLGYLKDFPSSHLKENDDIKKFTGPTRLAYDMIELRGMPK